MKTKLMLLTIMCFSVLNAKAETKLAGTQAMFIYNFLRYVQWPQNSVGDTYVIGVAGDTEVYNALIKYTSNREVAGKKIRVVKCYSSQDMLKCNVLYIPNEKCKCLNDINEQLKGRSCLTIFENCNNIKANATIDLYFADNTLKYRVNQEFAKNQNLIISNILVNLSI